MILLGQAEVPVLPPRPNPGPEPWPAEGMTPWALAAGLVAAALIALASWRLARRRVTRRRTEPRTDRGPVETWPGTPMERMAAVVRGALVARLGPRWIAKTTEEIAAEPALAEALGADRAAEVVRFLRAADRSRFSGEGPDPAQGADWEDWVAGFAAETVRPASAAATSP